MVRKKIIHNPLTNEDLIGLKLLEQVWWKSEILRVQLLKYSKKDRKKLLKQPASTRGGNDMPTAGLAIFP